MDDEILHRGTSYWLKISRDTTATPPSPPHCSAGSGDQFFSVAATFFHVATNGLLPPTGLMVSPSRHHSAFVPRNEFLSFGPEAVRTIFAPHLGLPSELTDDDVAGFALDIDEFAEAESQEGGPAVAVVPVQMRLTAVTYLQPDVFDDLFRAATETDAGFQTVPASEASVEALEVVAMDDDNNDDDQGRCTICLEDLFAGDHDHRELAKMPCSHLFHRECIVQWLEKSHFSPLCRYAMLTY